MHKEKVSKRHLTYLPKIENHSNLRGVHEESVLYDVRKIVLSWTHVAQSHWISKKLS